MFSSSATSKLARSAITFVFFAQTSVSFANLADWSGVTKTLDRFNEIVDRARDGALLVEYKFNKDMTNRIDQIDGIVEDTLREIVDIEEKVIKDTQTEVEHINSLIEERISDIQKVEKEIVIDAQKLIEDVNCKVKVAFAYDIKSALGTVGELIGVGTIKITPPLLYAGERQLLCVGDCRPSRVFEVRTPYHETYKEIKDYLLDRIKDGAREDTPITTITTTYGYIAELAKTTTCFSDATRSIYVDEYLRYAHMASVWRKILGEGGIRP